MKKRGFFFSTDALLALFLVAAGIYLVSTLYINDPPDEHISVVSEDVISIISTTKVKDLNNSYLQELVDNGTITDNSSTVVEQIGILWTKGKTDMAERLAKNITTQMVPPGMGFSFVIDDNVLYSNNVSKGEELATYKSLISGIEESKPIEGTSTRIYLSDIESHRRSEYIFFGGFIGQGNITRYSKELPSDVSMVAMDLEIDAGDNFTLYINGAKCKDFNITGKNMSSDYWNISSCNGLVNGGQENKFRFVFEDNQLNTSYIGGGYIRLNYNTDSVFFKNTNTTKYSFPGVDGVVNLYSGVSIPGNLSSMAIQLNYLANHSASNNTFYLTLGNKTLYRDNYSNNTMSVFLNNTYLDGLLNYSSLSNQTVPLRVGFENISQKVVYTDKGNGDVVAITDVSGSMRWEFDSSSDGIERFCRDIDLRNDDTMRLAVAKCILNSFSTDILYNITGNRVGLVSYSSDVRDYLDLARNLTRIEDRINEYYANGGTCISCGVMEGVGVLNQHSELELLNKRWKFTNQYQTSDPVDWYTNGYDDSAWQEGNLDFGFGTDSDYYTGNVVHADLWDHPDDVPAPVDFTTEIYHTYNTFGFMSQVETENLLDNSFYDGPSLSSWSQHGSISLSEPVILFSDNFDDGNLNGWNTHSGDHADGSPDAHTFAQNPATSGSHGARLTGGEDTDNSAGSGQTDHDDPWISRAIDLSTATEVMVTYSRASYAENNWFVDTHDAGEDFRFEWSIDSFSTVNQPENIEMRDGNLEDFNGDYIWSEKSFTLPGSALDSNFELRFSKDGSWDGEHAFVDDVVVKNLVKEIFGMRDYWYVNSSNGDGYVGQSFTSPSDSPNEVYLNLAHSINHSHFTTDSDVFCNLTHPGGEDVVWSESWSSGSPPSEGPIPESINITDKITSSSFNYIIECGCKFDSGGESLVAFDNISVDINWTNYGDDGWDYSQGVYGYSGNMMFFYNNSGELELAVNRNSNDASGSYGIQVYVTQEMIDAMNSAGGGAWLSFDYRWDARDDGTSGLFETSDQVWIKGYWESPSTGKHYLGSEENSEDSDSTPEIWTSNDPDNEGAGHFGTDISSWIDNGPGYYYLALGGKLHSSQNQEFGAFAFDNIQLAFTNQSGNTFYRNNFYINDINEVHQPIDLLITSDDGADVYLNGNQVDSYSGSVNSRSVTVTKGDFKRGENILAIKLKNNDGQGELSVQFNANITNRQKAMVIMSDGEATMCADNSADGSSSYCDDCSNRACCPDSSGQLTQPCPDYPGIEQSDFSGGEERAAEQLINLTCYYRDLYNISIYSVAFGDVAQGGKKTLNLTALCDPDYTDEEPHYFESDNPEGLSNIYGQIANKLRLAFSIRKSQILSMEGAYQSSHLYPDSYIEMNYTPITTPVIYGELPLFFRTKDFKGCTYNLNVPPELRVLEGYVTPYSGEHWTDYVAVDNSKGTHVAFNLSRFNKNYANLGDPFPIGIPGSYLEPGETNTITVRTGDSPTNSTNCSQNTTLHYTGLINVINYTMPYSSVLPNATGCNWNVEHRDGNIMEFSVPSFYNGTRECNYTNSSHELSLVGLNDSYNTAMFNLLSFLDYNNDGRVFVDFENDDLSVKTKIVRNIPYLWGPTVAEVRVWK